MTFTNREDYLAQRAELMNVIENLINEGKIDEGNTKMAEVEKLDKEFEDYAKAQANFNALNGIKHPAPINYGAGAVTGNNANEDMYNSNEYRKAFMNYVLKGSAIPTEFSNADANTKTSDVGAVIPTTVLQKIIENMESTGMILPLVTRTSYKGGVNIPKLTLKPTASWVSEGAGSETKKLTTGTVTFTYHKLRCAISVSLEVDTTAMSVFETTLIAKISEAMTKAIEQAIINGSGNGQPKGILTETAVGNVNITEGNSVTYADLCEVEGKLPLAYENKSVWFMTKSTFMSIMGMVDNNGQPIARINYGVNGKPERTILGRTVILNDYMSSFAKSVTQDTVFAFLFNPADYVLNTNLDITVKKYEDNKTDDEVTKAIMLTDGKVIDTGSLVTMTIKNS